jgi:hypothetical protein
VTIRDGFARGSSSIASTLHASKVADDLRKPWPHWPTRVRLAPPCGNPRFLDEIVGVVAVVRERARRRGSKYSSTNGFRDGKSRHMETLLSTFAALSIATSAGCGAPSGASTTVANPATIGGRVPTNVVTFLDHDWADIYKVSNLRCAYEGQLTDVATDKTCFDIRLCGVRLDDSTDESGFSLWKISLRLEGNGQSGSVEPNVVTPSEPKMTTYEGSHWVREETGVVESRCTTPNCDSVETKAKTANVRVPATVFVSSTGGAMCFPATITPETRRATLHMERRKSSADPALDLTWAFANK